MLPRQEVLVLSLIMAPFISGGPRDGHATSSFPVSHAWPPSPLLPAPAPAVIYGPVLSCARDLRVSWNAFSSRIRLAAAPIRRALLLVRVPGVCEAATNSSIAQGPYAQMAYAYF